MDIQKSTDRREIDEHTFRKLQCVGYLFQLMLIDQMKIHFLPFSARVRLFHLVSQDSRQ
jgi:hypothetical protein